MSEATLREQICMLAQSMFDRGLTGGSTGNISSRTEDGGLLVSPTGTSFGRLDPARLSRFDSAGNLIDGDPPTKEMPLHSAFYDTRSTAGAVVHLHSCHSVALSMMPDANEDDFLPPLTPYGIMKLGRVKLLPFFVPGDPRDGRGCSGTGRETQCGDAGQSWSCCRRQGRGIRVQRHRGTRRYGAAGHDDAWSESACAVGGSDQCGRDNL